MKYANIFQSPLINQPPILPKHLPILVMELRSRKIYKEAQEVTPAMLLPFYKKPDRKILIEPLKIFKSINRVSPFIIYN